MKTKIKIKKFNNCSVEIVNNGDWIDLRAAETIKCVGPYADSGKAIALEDGSKKKVHNVYFSSYKVPLGVAMKLPKGYEAIVNVRSSNYKNFKTILSNAQGVIDNTYCGNDDQWFAEFISFSNMTIAKGSRICQFRIQLSQKATFWQKLKWLFSSGVEIEIVDNLSSENRGGHGSTGVK